MHRGTFPGDRMSDSEHVTPVQEAALAGPQGLEHDGGAAGAGPAAGLMDVLPNAPALTPEMLEHLQRTAGNQALQGLLNDDAEAAPAADEPAAAEIQIPEADMGARARGRAYGLDWESQHREIDQNTTLREAFETNLAAQIERFFGESLTYAEVVARIEQADADGDTEESTRLTQKLSKAQLFAVVATLRVEQSDRYQPENNPRRTYCNIYAYDYVSALGGYLPRVWWTPDALRRIRAGEEVAVRYGRTVLEVNANAMTNWMRDFGGDFGWRAAADLNAAQDAANEGRVVILLARRANPRQSGHVSVVMPEIREADNVYNADGNAVEHLAGRNDDGNVTRPMQSQAGGTNVEYEERSADWLTGASYRDGAAWILDGAPQSPLLTPEQQGLPEGDDAEGAGGDAEGAGGDVEGAQGDAEGDVRD